MGVLENILITSEKLFMTYGLKSISMDDIAGEIGISKKTIYKHFTTKDRLIHITLSQYLEKEKKIVSKIATDSENAVEEIMSIGRHIITMARKLKPTLIFDLKKYHTKNWELIEEHHYNFIKEIIRKNLERGVQEGLFRSNMNCDIVAKLYVGKSLIIADESNLPMKQMSLEQLFKEHLLYHLYGVLSEEGTKIVKKHEIEAL